MESFKLSAVLEGHEDDVRGVVFPSPQVVISASRDATVRVWKAVNTSPPKFDDTIASHGNSFVNAVAYVQPSKRFPEGLIVAGGKDAIIEVREPQKAHQENAERLLTGHAHNICALDVSPNGQWIVSGSWDSTARIWDTTKWECSTLLEGHQGSVWGVLAYDEDTVITACADKLIRVFSTAGKLLRTIKGSKDVVRSLCRLPAEHSSGAQFGSAGNDSIIWLWQLSGREVAQLHGHESFIYAIAALPNGDLVSSGEDRTVRVWRSNECIQTITHPAISVWSVAVCAESGDIVSGASDRVVRVFSRSSDRSAEPAVIAAFDNAVKESAIPQQQVGDINKEKLPGPEFLQQKSGTKEGQVAMIKEGNGNVTAWTWSVAANTWVNVGTVVDAAGSSGKKTEYQGKEYDYVFDVDIEDGKPPLKLPYNLAQNPYEAASKFIQDNELPVTYLDQVGNFIQTNTQGASLGTSDTSQTPSGGDAWGTGARYRPGDGNAVPDPASGSAPAARPKVLPQKEYLSIAQANLKPLLKKIEELNATLLAQGEKNLSLNPQQLDVLRAIASELQPAVSTGLATEVASTPALREGLQLVADSLMRWPPGNRLPMLDLLRLLAAVSPLTAASPLSQRDSSVISLLDRSGVLADTDRPNNIMLGVRALANLFQTEAGRELVETSFDQIQTLLQPLYNSSTSSQTGSSATNSTAASIAGNRNLTIALTTLAINHSVQLAALGPRSPTTIERALTVLGNVVAILARRDRDADGEATYRALVATGTLLTLRAEVLDAARDVYELPTLLNSVLAKVPEPRVKAVVGEMQALLQ